MAYRRKTTTTRRKATPVRRRRRTMGQRVTTAGVTAAAMSAGKAALGGVAAAFLTNTLGNITATEKFAPYAGLLGSLATSLFLKQPEIAAGMAGYAGYKIAGALLPDLTEEGMFLAQNNSFNVSPSMYLQGDMTGTGIYASNYTLAGYDVPGL
jgi:hypothetical protein